MSREFTVVHDFLDTLGATTLPVNRVVGETYPPDGVNVPGKWLDALVEHRTVDGKPILKPKNNQRKEASETSGAE